MTAKSGRSTAIAEDIETDDLIFSGDRDSGHWSALGKVQTFGDVIVFMPQRLAVDADGNKLGVWDDTIAGASRREASLGDIVKRYGYATRYYLDGGVKADIVKSDSYFVVLAGGDLDGEYWFEAEAEVIETGVVTFSRLVLTNGIKTRWKADIHP